MVQTMVMAFGRRRSLQPLNSTKHVIDSEGGLTSTPSTNVIAEGVTVLNAVLNPVQCVTGSVVNGVYVSLFVIGDTGAPVGGSITWYICKARSGQDFTNDFPLPVAVGTSDVRNQIFHQEKGLAGSGDGTAMVFKGVIAIPKSMRRMREGDRIAIRIMLNSADSAQFCLQSIYKSWQ